MSFETQTCPNCGHGFTQKQKKCEICDEVLSKQGKNLSRQAIRDPMRSTAITFEDFQMKQPVTSSTEAISKELSKQTKFFMVIIFLLIPGGLGIAILIWVLYNLINGYLSEKWPFVEGLITVSTIVSGSDPRHDLEYQYSVKEILYKSNRKNFGGWEASGWNDTQKLEKYPPNSAVKVYYHPKRHHRSTLSSGIQYSNFLALIFLPFIIIPITIPYLVLLYYIIGG